MFIFYAHKDPSGDLILKDEEARHCAKVLRRKPGDLINVTLGEGHIISAEITGISRHEVALAERQIIESRLPEYALSIAIAPTKNTSRFEWFLEKAVEIGITEIIPFVSDHSERRNIKQERLEKIIISAMKQSKNVCRPRLHELTKFNEVITQSTHPQKLIAHCMDPDKHLKHVYDPGKEVLIVIGPEGDFSEEEVTMAKTNGFSDISLGQSRLRTETAGVVAASVINMMNVK